MKALLQTVLFAAALLGFTSGGVFAQDDAAFHVTYIEVLPGSSGKALGILRQARAASRKADGNVRFEVFQRRDRIHHFAMIEAWKDAPARDANLASAHSKAFRDALQALLAAGYDERPHLGLDVGQPNAAAGAKGATVFTVTHVDFIPPKKDEGIAALKVTVDSSRQESGAILRDAPHRRCFERCCV